MSSSGSFFFFSRASPAALLNLPHFSFHSSNLTNRIWTEASHAVNSHQRRLRVAEGDIYHSMCLPPRAIWNGSCCHRSLHQPVCFEGWRSQLAGSREESIVPLLWFTWPCTLPPPSPDSGWSGGWGRGAGREGAGGWAERRCGCSSAGPGGGKCR